MANEALGTDREASPQHGGAGALSLTAGSCAPVVLNDDLQDVNDHTDPYKHASSGGGEDGANVHVLPTHGAGLFLSIWAETTQGASITDPVIKVYGWFGSADADRADQTNGRWLLLEDSDGNTSHTMAHAALAVDTGESGVLDQTPTVRVILRGARAVMALNTTATGAVTTCRCVGVVHS